MNKQEAIDELENAIPDFILNDFQRGKETGLTYALELVNQLDELEKPVVPQFVADWYEDNKDDFEYNLYRLCIDYYERKLHEDLHEWFGNDKNKPIEVLVLMNKYGYEVEKEKLYVVAIPDDERNKFIQLWKNKDGKLFFNFADKIEYGKVHLLTKEEIKQKDERLLQFAKEAEE